MAEQINIGRAIHDELRRQERTVAWFARKLGTNRMTCYRMFNSYTIDTGLLERVSAVLNCDFFALYSEKITRNNEA